MTDREREHHDPGMDPTTARIPLGTDVPALEHSFEDEPPRLSTEDQRTVEALRPRCAVERIAL